MWVSLCVSLSTSAPVVSKSHCERIWVRLSLNVSESGCIFGGVSESECVSGLTKREEAGGEEEAEASNE